MSYPDENHQDRRQGRQKLAFSISGDLYDIILEQATHQGVGIHEHIEALLKHALAKGGPTYLDRPEPRKPVSQSGKSQPAKGDGKDLLNLNETAAALRVSRWTVSQLATRGEIPYVPVAGRKMFILPDVLEALKAKGQAEQPPSLQEILLKRQTEDMRRARLTKKKKAQ